MKPTYQILKTAKEIVETRWQKYGMGSKDGPRCAAGALQEAFVTNGGASLPDGSYTRAREAVKSLIADEYLNDVIFFNDAPKTTQADVVKLFKKAMRKVR